MADETNIVSAPPLTSPLIDKKTGMPARPWTMWFRDIYRRTAYKGGNAIDDNLETLEDVIAQVIINIQDIADNADAIQDNADAIEVNAQNIQINADNIQDNADNIATNTQDILNLEHRALGEDKPAAYQETGVSYSVGDLVVYPSTDPQNYYVAQVDIAAPAGLFDSTKWIEKSLRNSVDTELFLELTAIKAVHFAFTGTSVNGAVTPAFSWNVATLTRVGVGVYNGTVEQSTFYGVDIFSKANPFVSYSFSTTITTEAFHVDFTATGGGGFTIEVFEWVQGVGSKIELVPYDPDTAGDLVFCTVLSDIGNGELPPP